ncbi:MAG: flagellar motor switch phosphatase FliY [Bacillota bacterium]|jgi:flagellar motor switch protein FliN/FliY|nr:flagellar motor switch phosphatase FliY [Bacillota bacterium]NLP25531.1 flagellar motor switch phosphatase FliY [Syntrophomonadaceae bacterium]
MSDGILSQEEIDALLKGDSPEAETTETPKSFTITDFEEDALGEIGNITMGTSATTLSTLLKKKVSITTPKVSITTPEQLRADYPLPYVVVEVNYTQGLQGSNILIVKESDAVIMSDLMMGGQGLIDQSTLSEIDMSAVSEAMNQMMGSSTTSLSSMFNRRIDISPPSLTLVDLGKNSLDFASEYDELVAIKFKMEIEDLVNSEIMQIIPVEAVQGMMALLMGSSTEESGAEVVLDTPEPEPEVPVMSQSSDIVPEPEIPVSNQSWEQPYYQSEPSPVRKNQQFAVQPVQFANLQEMSINNTPQNIGLIMDVPLDVSVELGKTRKTIHDILELHQGAIIQLDKMAGEPVDLLVNGKLIAKGEVVVIDETYGIRITAIISPSDRMNKLQ